MIETVFWDNTAITATQRSMINANQHAWWGF
jgi:hypothetical protein